MRDYPAYGRTIAAHIVRGQKPICVGVLLSTRWRYFDHVPKVCIKPEEWERGRFEFGYLRGLHVVAVPGDDCAPAQLGELVVDLMATGPETLWCFDCDGRELYAGEDTSALALWAYDLAEKRVGWSLVKGAQRRMDEAIAAAAATYVREAEAIKARAGDEAAVEFHLRAYRIKDRVRELFGAGFQASGEPAAA